jgi:hypothetical protein
MRTKTLGLFVGLFFALTASAQNAQFNGSNIKPNTIPTAAYGDGSVTDAKASLLVKPAVTVVATANQTLSAVPTIDGQALADGSIVLATAQSTGSQNGPWVVHAGAWTRPTWYSPGSTTQAPQFSTTFVRLGTLYSGTTWRLTTASVVVDTTATTWSQTPLAVNSSSVSNGVTGTGAEALAISPSLTTPNLGAASATTLNKLTLTAPASGATLTLADGKVFTVSNTLTFTGTDSSSAAFGAGGTVAYIGNKLSAFAATTSAELASVLSDESGSGVVCYTINCAMTTPNLGTPSAVTLTNGTGLPVGSGISGLGTGVATLLSGSSSGTGGPAGTASPTFTGTPVTPSFSVSGAISAAAWGTAGVGFKTIAATYTDTSSSGTVTGASAHTFAIPTFAASSATTFTNASTLSILGAPVAGTNVTNTNSYALRVHAGLTNLGGGLVVSGNTQINVSNNASTSIGTGTTTSAVNLGGASNALNLSAAGGTVGLFGVTAAARTAAYTQTYSTASRTVPALTSAAVTTTAASNVTPWGYSTQAQADAIVAAINALRTDVDAVKQVVNSVIDDQQTYGWFQ